VAIFRWGVEILDAYSNQIDHFPLIQEAGCN